MASSETVVVTGASQGIGALVIQAFPGRGYNVVGNSRSFANAGFAPSPNLALVEGNIGLMTTIAAAAVSLTEARYVTGEVLHVDGGAHAGRW